MILQSERLRKPHHRIKSSKQRVLIFCNERHILTQIGREKITFFLFLHVYFVSYERFDRFSEFQQKFISY